MKIFRNCTVVLEFDLNTPFKQKVEWRKKITENGGVVSFVMTKRVSFLVVFNRKTTSSAYKLRQSIRYDIPVVQPKYIDMCIQKERLLKTNTFIIPVGSNESFKKGKIQDTKDRNRGIRQRRFKVVVNLEKQPSWIWGMSSAPVFNEDNFELPKWALLIKKEGTQVQVIEVHVQSASQFDDNAPPIYRLYTQSGIVTLKTVSQAEDAVVWYFETAAEVISGNEQLYRRYTATPMTMKPCQPGEVNLGELGSKKLRLTVGQLSLLHEKVSNQVAALVDGIWNEALHEIDAHLEVPMNYANMKAVEEAHIVLRQLGTILSSGGDGEGQEVRTLIDQFYEALPHKPEHRKDIWSLQDVVAMQDFCQLLSDIVTVSEATDWSSDAAIIAKYRALACHIQHLNQSTEEFSKVSRLVQDSMEKGGIVHSVYKVWKTVESVSFDNDIGRNRLLMHASPAHNYLGILSRGLLLPNSVQDERGVIRTDSGHLGCGIYFSDSAMKSLQYTTPFSQSGTQLLLLCDVALGHEHSVSKPDFTLIAPPEGYDSVHGVAATPDQTSFFKDNEYAIYSTHQQCLRYVVEVSLPSDKIAMNKVISSNRTLQEDVGPVLQSLQATEVDTSDVRDIIDPLAKVKAGLQGSSKEPVPLKSVHVRARMLDLVAQVVVLQAYRNDSSCSIEAKYVFPLDETAAVCGFEAFINGKHIIGQCKEKAKARREYKEAVSKGHGAYLMEEESADVFTVSIGNLPPQSDVLIKITYIMELAVDGDAVCLNVPASVAPWIKDRAAAQKTQSMTKTVNAGFNKQGTVTLQVSIEMATEIRRVLSPTHNIKLKKTATKAVVTLPKKSSLESGFQLQVYLVAIHMPRMWVERHPEYNTQACMLTFYPEFETVPESEPELLIILDMSNSMKGSAETDAKKVALLTLDNLPKTCVFNIMVFGSSFRELFSAPQKCSEFSREIARQFIQGISASLGSTDLFEPIHAVQCLGSPTSPLKNLFLISDGHVTQESLVTMVTKSTASKLRMFTLGVGDTPNHHFLKNLASVGGGDYQCFYNKTKSQWERKMKSLLEKISQPGLSEVKIDWLQTDDIAQPPVQTPNQIPSLFSGCRQVVYGFVEGCMQATLKAKVQGQEMETTVSTTDLQVTTGKMLHQLVARSVISDYENGVFNPDRIKHEVIKLQKKASIIEMSKKFSIVTPYTSFVAVEDRSQDELVNVDGPAIEDLVAKETVDLLPYIDWESHQEIEDKDVVHTVKELLQKGEVQETFSMVRAEEIYCQLANYVSEIQENPMLAKQVYDSLGRYYKHNQSASVGNILSDLEPFLQGNDNRMMLSSDKDGDISRSKQLNISADTKHYLSALVPEFAIYDPKSRAMKVHCQTGKKRKKRKRSRWDPKETSNEIVEVMIVDETHSENEAHRNVGGIKHGVDNIVLNEMEDMFVGNFANTELLLENTVNLSENIERTKQAHSLIAQTSHMNDKPAPCEKKSGPVYRKSIALARKKQIATKSVPAAESIMTDSEEDDIDLDYNDDMIDMETDDLSEIAGLFTADTSDIPSNVYGDITDVYNQLDTSEAEGWEELTPKVLMADSKSKQVTNKEDDSHCQILYEQLCSENTAMNQTALSAALLSAPQEIQEEGRISNNELADDTEKEFSPMLNNGLSMAPDISASEYYANFESTQQTYIPTAYMSNFQITPSMVQSSSQLTPAYSPMAPAYSSMAPVFSSTTQTYSNKSPAFSPMSPAYSTMTAARRSHGHKETSISQPLIGHGSLYKKCGSPSYSPTSPCYSPVSPGFIADTTPVSVSRCERPTDSDEDQYRGRENRQIGKLNSLLGNTRSRSKRSSSTESKTEIIICRNPRRRSRSNSLSSRCRFGSRERRHSKQRSKSRSRERRHRKQRSRSRSRERRHRKQRSRSRSRERRHRMHNEKRIGKILSGKTHLERDRSDRSTAEKVSNDQIENAQLEKKIANSSLKAVSHRKIMQVEDILGGYEQFRERYNVEKQPVPHSDGL